ncbi:hypothetical protein SAY87_028070 [Trapa incisa]|uniref:Uncharacterized protein n=1 Tax=Trapa incisa TaxID=236973 RepID=A0AAN7KU23_9MYRT|nr:hypothetical protein SAY87_028070 [Trapa incisa]
MVDADDEARKERREAPTRDPRAGNPAEAPLDGPEAGAVAGLSAAKAALMEAAATRKAQSHLLHLNGEGAGFFFSVPFETRFQGDGCSECLCLLCDFIGTLSMKEWVAKGIYKAAKSHFQEVCNGNYRGQRLERRHVFGAARSAECQRAIPMEFGAHVAKPFGLVP